MMTNITRYNAADLSTLMDRIVKNSIGMDDYFDRFWGADTQSNYPPYNLIQINNVESRLEIALAGFKKNEVKVYTEFGKLHVEGKKEESKDDGEFVFKGLAKDPLPRLGRSLMIRKYDRSALRMDSSQWNWER